jgi:hypothetical protein
METVGSELELPELVELLELPALPAAVGALVPLFEELLHPATRAIEMATAATRSPVRDT